MTSPNSRNSGTERNRVRHRQSRDDQEMNRTVLSHLCWVDNIWLFARDTMFQTMVDELDAQHAPQLGNALEVRERADHVRIAYVQEKTQYSQRLELQEATDWSLIRAAE